MVRREQTMCEKGEVCGCRLCRGRRQTMEERRSEQTTWGEGQTMQEVKSCA